MLLQTNRWDEDNRRIFRNIPPNTPKSSSPSQDALYPSWEYTTQYRSLDNWNFIFQLPELGSYLVIVKQTSSFRFVEEACHLFTILFVHMLLNCQQESREAVVRLRFSQSQDFPTNHVANSKWSCEIVISSRMQGSRRYKPTHLGPSSWVKVGDYV